MEKTYDLSLVTPEGVQTHLDDGNADKSKAAGSLGAVICAAQEKIDQLVPFLRLETDECKANKKTIERVGELLKTFGLRWSRVKSCLELLKTSVYLLMVNGVNYCKDEGRSQFEVGRIFGEQLQIPMRERQASLLQSLDELKEVMSQLEKLSIQTMNGVGDIEKSQSLEKIFLNLTESFTQAELELQTAIKELAEIRIKEQTIQNKVKNLERTKANFQESWDHTHKNYGSLTQKISDLSNKDEQAQEQQQEEIKSQTSAFIEKKNRLIKKIDETLEQLEEELKGLKQKLRKYKETGKKGADPTRTHYFILIDRSASMNEQTFFEWISKKSSKYDRALECLSEFIEGQRSNDRDFISLISFSDSFKQAARHEPISKVNFNRLKEEMRQQKMSGTRCAEALEVAISEIKRFPEEHTVLFLLTDGKMQDQSAVLTASRLFNELRQQHAAELMLISMGIGQECDWNFLHQMSFEANDGQTHEIRIKGKLVAHTVHVDRDFKTNWKETFDFCTKIVASANQGLKEALSEVQSQIEEQQLKKKRVLDELTTESEDNLRFLDTLAFQGANQANARKFKQIEELKRQQDQLKEVMKQVETEIGLIDNEILSAGQDLPHKDQIEIKLTNIEDSKAKFLKVKAARIKAQDELDQAVLQVVAIGLDNQDPSKQAQFVQAFKTAYAQIQTRLNEGTLLVERVLEDSKLIERLIANLKEREDTYEFQAIKDTILEIVATEFPDLQTIINNNSHLDDQKNIILLAERFCGLNEEQVKSFATAIQNLHLSDILSKPFDNDAGFQENVIKTIKTAFQRQLDHLTIAQEDLNQSFKQSEQEMEEIDERIKVLKNEKKKCKKALGEGREKANEEFTKEEITLKRSQKEEIFQKLNSAKSDEEKEDLRQKNAKLNKEILKLENSISSQEELQKKVTKRKEAIGELKQKKVKVEEEGEKLQEELKIVKRQLRERKGLAEADVSYVMPVITLVRKTILQRMKAFNHKMIARDIGVMISMVQSQIFSPVEDISKEEKRYALAPEEAIPQALKAIKM